MRQKAYNLLRWSEQYTKTDMVYLARGGFWLTLGQAVASLSTLILAIAFANLLPPESYGVYQFVLAMASIMSVTTLSGLNTATIRSVAKGAEEMVISSLKIKIKFGTIGSIIGLLASGYYLLNNNQTLAISFAIVAIFLPFFYTLGIGSSFLKGKKLFEIDTKYNIANILFTSGVLITTLFLTNNILIILVTYFGSWTIAYGLVFLSTIKRFKKTNVDDPESMAYGKHLSVMGIIGTAADHIDKLLIFHFLGALEVALYSFALAPISQIKGVLKNIHILALPKFSQKTKTEMREALLRKSFIIMILFLPITFGYMYAAPYIYKTIFPVYTESIIFSQALALMIPLSVFGVLSGSILEAQAEIKRKYLITASSKILKIILIVSLVIPYGIWGIIAGTLIAQLITTSLSFWLAAKT